MRLIAVFLLSLVFLTACKKKPQQQEYGTTAQPATESEPKGVEEAEADVPAPFDKTIKYAGKIDKKYDINMTLHFKGDSAFGEYVYTSKNTPLTLKGSLLPEKLWQIHEFSPEGEKSGTFEIDVNGQEISGLWSADKDKKLSVELRETEQKCFVSKKLCKSGQIEIITKRFEKISKNEKCQYSESYAQLDGMDNQAVQKKINTLLEPESPEEIMKDVDNCEGEFEGFEEVGSYTLNHISDRFVSISLDFYSYYAGAAHGNYGSQTVNIDMQTGEKIPNTQLFIGGYEKKMNALIKAKIADEYGDVGLDFTSVDAKQSYDLYDDRIEVYFNPYDIGPYAAGQIRFSFPYTEVADIIYADGPLGNKIQ